MNNNSEFENKLTFHKIANKLEFLDLLQNKKVMFSLSCAEKFVKSEQQKAIWNVNFAGSILSGWTRCCEFIFMVL